MGTPRLGALATSLPNGRALVVGGYSSSATLANAETFDPLTAAFSSAGLGSMPNVRSNFGMSPLADGRVLLAGGYGGTFLASAEAFDPATGLFSSAGIGAMSTPRSSPVAAPLPGGRVLVTGGGNPGSGDLATSEIFSLASPPSNAFTVSVKGRRLLVAVTAAGKVDVAAASATKRAALKPSGASGGPGTIEVPLSLSKAARHRLKSKHKLTVTASVTFTPTGGTAKSQTTTLKLSGGK
jgi:hypothetical protein